MLQHLKCRVIPFIPGVANQGFKTVPPRVNAGKNNFSTAISGQFWPYPKFQLIGHIANLLVASEKVCNSVKNSRPGSIRISKSAAGAEITKYSTAVRVKEYIIRAYIRVGNTKAVKVKKRSNDILIRKHSICQDGLCQWLPWCLDEGAALASDTRLSHPLITQS